MNAGELLKNIYGDNRSAGMMDATGSGDSNGLNKTVEEVWKEIAATARGDVVDPKIKGVGEGPYFKDPAYEEMTLEDFLAKAGAVREEDVRASQDPMQQQIEGSGVGFGNGLERGAGRGKRRVVEEPVDKATLRRQKRMIKNRESAARSRERKQAYTVELESVVTKLEEENARLLREQEEQTKKRFKQLMEYLIPIQEQRRPPRTLKRVRSMQW